MRKGFQLNRLLKQAREEQHWAYEDLAAKIGVDPGTVRRWELGESRPHLENRQKLCNIFMRTTDELGLHPLMASLPPQRSLVIGRKREINTLNKQLQRGQSVAIVGMGGVGKSILAKTVMEHLTQKFPGGCIWVSCEYQQEFEGLVWIYDQLFDMLDIHLPPEEKVRLSTLEKEVNVREQILQNRVHIQQATLVVLDNIERYFPLSRIVDHLINLGITVMITSHIIPLTHHLKVIPLGYLGDKFAIQMFVSYFVSKGGSWLPKRDEKATATIVERLGYLPLAIELIAARAALRPNGIQLLREELDTSEAIALLKYPSDSTESVRYSLNKSLETLSKNQKMRYAALSILRGPDIPHAVAMRMLAKIGLHLQLRPEDDLDLFIALSLVIVEGDSQNLRIRLHPLLRELGTEIWKNADKETQDNGRLGLVRGIRLYVEEHQHDYTRIERDEALIKGALQNAWPNTDFFATITALSDYLNIRADYQFGKTLYMQAFTVAHEHGLKREAAAALSSLGIVAYSQGEFFDAMKYLEESLRLAEELGDRQLQYDSLVGLASYVAEDGDYYKRYNYYKRAREIYEESESKESDRDNEIDTETLRYTWGYTLGYPALFLGELDEAESYYKKALAKARSRRDVHAEISLMNDSGIVIHTKILMQFQNKPLLKKSDGDVQEALIEAIQHFKRLRELSVKAKNRFGTASALYHLGRLQRIQGNYQEAQNHCDKALAMFEELNYKALELLITADQGILLAKQDNPKALQTFSRALSMARQRKHRVAEAIILNNLEDLYDKLGGTVEAIQCRQESEDLNIEKHFPKNYIRFMQAIIRLD